MNRYNLNCYLPGSLLALFLCIGTAHAEKVVEHDCYLSNLAGNPVDLKDKPTTKPIHLFNWEVENNYVATVKKPYPIKDLNIEKIGDRRHINFKHSYCVKTPVRGKSVIMTDQWELVQSDIKPPSGVGGDFLDLTLILDPKHNIIGTKPKVMTHKLLCQTTEINLKETNIHINPRDDYYTHNSSENSVTKSTSSDEGDSLRYEHSKKDHLYYEITFRNEEPRSQRDSVSKSPSYDEGDSSAQCSSAKFNENAEAFWAGQEGQE